ncbi:MAG TPA: PqqD family protein [Gemmatimonadaceae bacterium]|nr:PqqD family protein [Gemmatimonadaceae bacterium]
MLPVANPKVIYRALSEGAVLLSTADEVYFGLNEVGARIWEHLPPVTHTLEELCTAVHAAYPEADLETIRTDTVELLAELAEHGLVVQNTAMPGEGQGVRNIAAEAGQTEPR